MKCKSSKILILLFKVLTFVQGIFWSMNVYAIEQSKLVQGTITLASDATTACLAMEAVVIGALEIKTGIAYQTAEPEDKKGHKKEAKQILIVGILIVAATSLIKVILGYFV